MQVTDDGAVFRTCQQPKNLAASFWMRKKFNSVNFTPAHCNKLSKDDDISQAEKYGELL
jgi:hypothetical protein